mmetsp:Transcript_26091/g.68600  ORF Transcript_26091/g.68600 Transcript_26091/m.68600 type:complete len:229 (+) Transcript_26091:672-1358(+)
MRPQQPIPETDTNIRTVAVVRDIRNTRDHDRAAVEQIHVLLTATTLGLLIIHPLDLAKGHVQEPRVIKILRLEIHPPIWNHPHVLLLVKLSVGAAFCDLVEAHIFQRCRIGWPLLRRRCKRDLFGRSLIVVVFFAPNVSDMKTREDEERRVFWILRSAWMSHDVLEEVVVGPLTIALCLHARQTRLVRLGWVHIEGPSRHMEGPKGRGGSKLKEQRKEERHQMNEGTL